MHVCEHVHWRENHVPPIFLLVICSHRSSRSSISLSGCAAPRLRWGRWGRPCPPLCWSAGDSSAAPPPWTASSSAGCLSAQPPPHHRALPEYWPTGGRSRERFNKDSMATEGRDSIYSMWKSISITLNLPDIGKTPQWTPYLLLSEQSLLLMKVTSMKNKTD